MPNIAQILAMPAAPGDWWDEEKIATINVTVFTEDDDKDDGENVTLSVLYGPFVSKVDLGTGRIPDQDTRTVSIPLTPHPPLSAKFSLRVFKSPKGSPTGCQWNAAFDMSGVTESGASVNISGRTRKFEIGDGHSYDLMAIQDAHAPNT